MSKIIKEHKPCFNNEGVLCCKGKYCCYRFTHLSRNGCKVKALSCKLWFCHEVAIELSTSIREEIHYYNKLVRKHDLSLCRFSKKSTMLYRRRRSGL